MYALVDPLIKLFGDSSWATVGDGRYGTDAMYLASKGIKVTATDIDDRLLKLAHEKGLIDAYQKQNAEKLSFDDKAFDFIYCKEAYHHFPRPTIALYEMLRVAKRGCVLLEPIDREIASWVQQLFLSTKNFIKRALKKPVSRDFFEEEGNYLFSVSKREFEKIALGLGHRFIIFKGINDIYLEGMEDTKLDTRSRLYKKMLRKKRVYDALSRLGLIPYNLLFTAFIKEHLNDETICSLRSEGYEVIELPKNPYLFKS